MKISTTDHLAFVVLQILSEQDDGKMLMSEVMSELGRREGHNIPEEFNELTRHGDTRWENGTKFATITFVRANYMKKGKGVWRILPEGEEAVKLGEEAAIKAARSIVGEKNKDKRRGRQDLSADAGMVESVGAGENSSGDEMSINVESAESVVVDGGEKSLDDYESDAKTSIKEYIYSMDPYAFQDLCAALLRGMEYHVRDVASPGPDGGVDIVAYNDPLGSQPPRIKVQVKHYTTNKVSGQEVNNLAGLLREGDIGVIITSSSFTRDCERAARDNPRHIDLIDFDRLIDLWVEHYDELSTEDKALLPMQPIYFLSK